MMTYHSHSLVSSSALAALPTLERELELVCGGSNAISTADSVSVASVGPGSFAASHKDLSDIHQKWSYKQSSIGISLGFTFAPPAAPPMPGPGPMPDGQPAPGGQLPPGFASFLPR